MIYDSTGGGTRYIFRERIDLLSLLMTFYSRPFSSIIGNAWHHPLPGRFQSFTVNHCSHPHLFSKTAIGSVLRILFAKSRLNCPVIVSIEHMRRINDYNAVHYICDRFVSGRINNSEPLFSPFVLEGDTLHWLRPRIASLNTTLLDQYKILSIWICCLLVGQYTHRHTPSGMSPLWRSHLLRYSLKTQQGRSRR